MSADTDARAALAAIRSRDAATIKANRGIERCRDQAKVDRHYLLRLVPADAPPLDAEREIARLRAALERIHEWHGGTAKFRTESGACVCGIALRATPPAIRQEAKEGRHE